MPYIRPKLVISTVGIGLVTKGLEEATRNLVNENSNIAKNEELPQDVRTALEAGKMLTRGQLSGHSYKVAAELSSLAAVFGWHDGQAPALGPGDAIQLITTDTHVGHACVDAIDDYFASQMIAVTRIVSKGLQTKDPGELQVALADLTKQLSEVVEMYQATHDIIFNLTGGFKLISAYLQQIATLLGATSCYLFEGSRTLIYIPKMPIALDVQLFADNDENLHTMRQIALELPITNRTIADDLLNRAGVLFFDKHIMDGYYLSPWGVVVWQKIRQQVYGSRLLEPPSPKISFADKKKLEQHLKRNKRYTDVNDTIDVLAKWLIKNEEPLQSHKIKYINNAVAQYEIYAWNDGNAGRLFFNKRDNGTVEILSRVDHL